MVKFESRDSRVAPLVGAEERLGVTLLLMGVDVLEKSAFLAAILLVHTFYLKRVVNLVLHVLVDSVQRAVLLSLLAVVWAKFALNAVVAIVGDAVLALNWFAEDLLANSTQVSY